MKCNMLLLTKKWLITGGIFFLCAVYCLADDHVTITENINITPYSMDLYGSIDCVKPGDLLSVFDSDNILCGSFTIVKPSQYGFLHVYGDDPQTLKDEGASMGDILSFQINGMPIDVDPITWVGDARRLRVDFNCKQSVK